MALSHRGTVEDSLTNVTLVDRQHASTDLRSIGADVTFEFDDNLQSMRAPERPQSAPPVSQGLDAYQETGSGMLPLPAGGSMQAAQAKVEKLNLSMMAARAAARARRQPTGGPSDFGQLQSDASAGARPDRRFLAPRPKTENVNASLSAQQPSRQILYRYQDDQKLLQAH